MAPLQPSTNHNVAAPDNLQILVAAAADDATSKAGRSCPPLSASCALHYHINCRRVPEIYTTADLPLGLMDVGSLQWKSGKKFLLTTFKKNGSRGRNKKLEEYVFPQCLLRGCITLQQDHSNVINWWLSLDKEAMKNHKE
jgi:hypothetical protein